MAYSKTRRLCLRKTRRLRIKDGTIKHFHSKDIKKSRRQRKPMHGGERTRMRIPTFRIFSLNSKNKIKRWMGPFTNKKKIQVKSPKEVKSSKSIHHKRNGIVVIETPQDLKDLKDSRDYEIMPYFLFDLVSENESNIGDFTKKITKLINKGFIKSVKDELKIYSGKSQMILSNNVGKIKVTLLPLVDSHDDDDEKIFRKLINSMNKYNKFIRNNEGDRLFVKDEAKKRLEDRASATPLEMPSDSEESEHEEDSDDEEGESGKRDTNTNPLIEELVKKKSKRGGGPILADPYIESIRMAAIGRKASLQVWKTDSHLTTIPSDSDLKYCEKRSRPWSDEGLQRRDKIFLKPRGSVLQPDSIPGIKGGGLHNYSIPEGIISHNIDFFNPRDFRYLVLKGLTTQPETQAKSKFRIFDIKMDNNLSDSIPHGRNCIKVEFILISNQLSPSGDSHAYDFTPERVLIHQEFSDIFSALNGFKPSKTAVEEGAGNQSVKDLATRQLSSHLIVPPPAALNTLITGCNTALTAAAAGAAPATAAAVIVAADAAVAATSAALIQLLLPFHQIIASSLLKLPNNSISNLAGIEEFKKASAATLAGIPHASPYVDNAIITGLEGIPLGPDPTIFSINPASFAVYIATQKIIDFATASGAGLNDIVAPVPVGAPPGYTYRHMALDCAIQAAGKIKGPGTNDLELASHPELLLLLDPAQRQRILSTIIKNPSAVLENIGELSAALAANPDVMIKLAISVAISNVSEINAELSRFIYLSGKEALLTAAAVIPAVAAAGAAGAAAVAGAAGAVAAAVETLLAALDAVAKGVTHLEIIRLLQGGIPMIIREINFASCLLEDATSLTTLLANGALFNASMLSLTESVKLGLIYADINAAVTPLFNAFDIDVISTISANIATSISIMRYPDARAALTAPAPGGLGNIPSIRAAIGLPLGLSVALESFGIVNPALVGAGNPALVGAATEIVGNPQELYRIIGNSQALTFLTPLALGHQQILEFLRLNRLYQALTNPGSISSYIPFPTAGYPGRNVLTSEHIINSVFSNSVFRDFCISINGDRGLDDNVKYNCALQLKSTNKRTASYEILYTRVACACNAFNYYNFLNRNNAMLALGAPPAGPYPEGTGPFHPFFYAVWVSNVFIPSDFKSNIHPGHFLRAVFVRCTLEQVPDGAGGNFLKRHNDWTEVSNLKDLRELFVNIATIWFIDSTKENSDISKLPGSYQIIRIIGKLRNGVYNPLIGEGDV